MSYFIPIHIFCNECSPFIQITFYATKALSLLMKTKRRRWKQFYSNRWKCLGRYCLPVCVVLRDRGVWGANIHCTVQFWYYFKSIHGFSRVSHWYFHQLTCIRCRRSRITQTVIRAMSVLKNNHQYDESILLMIIYLSYLEYLRWRWWSIVYVYI